MVVRTMATSDIVKPPKEDHNTMENEVPQQKDKIVDRKRKAESEVNAPSKKTKTINDGFCIFVGNLNTTKKYEEVKDSLANYLQTKSLLFEAIRLDHSRKFAYVDLTTEIDVSIALKLNGQKVLDKPLRIAKAKIKVKHEEKKKAKPLPQQKTDTPSKCLSVKNLPHNATRAEILSIFNNAVNLRFPGGTKDPSKGIAVVEFKTKEAAEKTLKKKQGKKIRDNVIEINLYKTKPVPKSRSTPAEDAPSKTLFVKKLSPLVSEVKLKKVFKSAVSTSIPKKDGKARGFAFVEFPTVEDAKKAKELLQSKKIAKKAIEVQYCRTSFQPVVDTVLLTTLNVDGLAQETNETTLKNAFEGCLSARIPRHKTTRTSKGYGFVEFADKEACKAAMETMEDCEIDGKKVTLSYARPPVNKAPPGEVPGEVPVVVEEPIGPQKKRNSKRNKSSKQGGLPPTTIAQDEAKAVKD